MNMRWEEEIINKIAQNKIDYNIGLENLLNHSEYNFENLFTILRNYQFNSKQNRL